MQLVLDEVSCFPAGQLVQLVRDEVSSLPAGQLMQLPSVWLEDDWYWPLLHATHEPLDTLWPVPQLVEVEVQSLTESEPADDVRPLGQSMHHDRSSRSYWPAGQLTQCVLGSPHPVFTSCFPAGQSVQCVRAAVSCVPAPHKLQ